MVFMQRALVITVLLAVSCGGPDIPRLPPLSVGAGGVRMMSESRTPAEAYETAFAQLTGLHNRVRMGLGPSEQRNYLDATQALEEIAENLRVMRSVVEESAKPAYEPYIEEYTELALDVGRRRPPANWQTRVDISEKEVKSKFSYAQAPIVAEWPPGLGPTKESPAPTNTSQAKAPPPQPLAADPFDPKPSAPVPAPAMPSRLAFKAWKQSHADLAAAFAGGKDATSAYEDVKSAIAAMKQSIPASRHAKLDLMVAVYEQQHGETKGFSAVPSHGNKELIQKQLDVVRETLETEYDPDRK